MKLSWTGQAAQMWERKQGHTEFWLGKLLECDHIADQDTQRIVLKHSSENNICYQIKRNEMSGSCSMHGEIKNAHNILISKHVGKT